MSRCRTLVVGLLLTGATLPVAPASAARISLGDRTLRKGMHGTDVRVLQDFLTRVGFATTVDGQYGSGTTRNVRGWERRSSLKVNGSVSRRDAAMLRGQVNEGVSGLNATGGTQPLAPTSKATLSEDGTAIAPTDAPPAVAQVIAAANEIVGKPYKYGGGHGDWEDDGYDCSGSESYALHGAGLVTKPLDSTDFMSWGEPGEGIWITSYANSGHSYLVVAGLRFDTGYHNAGRGPRWSDEMRPADAYVARHPAGL